MKLMILGDTHGNIEEANRSYTRAKAREADAIVQVGDFGFWHNGEDFIQTITRRFNKSGIPLYWLPGNHEAYDLLEGYADSEKTPEGFWTISPGCYYIPRGTKWEWDGVTFMAVGGAVSVDKEYRLAVENGTTAPAWGHYYAEKPQGNRTLWWEEEATTDEDVAYAKSQGTVDVLLTHDSPTSAPFSNKLKEDIDSQINRQKMNEIGKSAQPHLWFHGHYHEFMDYEFMHDSGTARVIGLDRDTHNANWVMLDTSEVFDKAGSE